MDVKVTALSHAADYTIFARKTVSHVDMIPIHLGQPLFSYIDCNSNGQHHTSARFLIRHGWIVAIKVKRRCPLWALPMKRHLLNMVPWTAVGIWAISVISSNPDSETYSKRKIKNKKIKR
jgi:hypothetical protein